MADRDALAGESVASLSVRAARPPDASAIAAMANALNRHVGKPGDLFTREVVLRDGFGPDRAFSALIAELDGAVVGYATFNAGYNSDIAACSLWLVDLFVLEHARGRGAGRALLAAVAAEATRRGLASVEWGVLTSNRAARAFYHSIGARDADVRILTLDGAALHALAREAEPHLTDPRAP